MRIFTVAIAAALALGVAAAGSSAPVARGGLSASPAAVPLIGLTKKGRTMLLARYDARSLRPDARRAVRVADYAAYAYSPDGSKLVLSGPNDPSSGVRGRLAFFETARLTRLGSVELDRGVRPSQIAWPTSGRLLVLAWQRDTPVVYVVDPVARRVLARHTVEGSIHRVQPTARGLVLLLTPESEIGPSRLAVVDVNGRVRYADLDEIWAGSDLPEETEEHPPFIRGAWPALAVDGDATRAFVIPAGNRVATVELDSLAVAYHAVEESSTVFTRLANWLQPAAEAKMIDGPTRHAVWLGDGRLAVAGYDHHAGIAQGKAYQVGRPAGFKVIDTRTWHVEMVEPRAAAFARAGDGLLLYGDAWDSRTKERDGMGLTAYGLDGRERFHVLGDEPVYHAVAIGDRAYAFGTGKYAQVIDLPAGRVIGVFRREFPSLLLPDATGY